MNTIYESPQDKFAALIEQVCSIIIGQTVESVKENFSDHEFYVADYCNEKGYEKIIDIKITEVNLVCFFPEDKICNCCLCDFNNCLNINTYIDYCNAVYDYNFITQSWNLGNLHLMLKPTEKGVILTVISTVDYIGFRI